MIYRFNDIKKNRRGFTLIEILVSISLLSVLILSITGIYFNISNNQRELTAESFVHSDLEYFLQVFSNNTRLAEISDGNKCGIGVNRFFLVSEENDSLTFTKDSDCFVFSLDDNRISIDKAAFPIPQFLTSSHTNISQLYFIVEDNISLGQPIVTVYVKASPIDDPSNYIDIQTSISVNY